MKWQDPGPSKRQSGGKYQEVAEQLRANPGKWALVIESASPSMASNIRQGGIKAFNPVGDFEATYRGTGNGQADIFVRYVGHERLVRVPLTVANPEGLR